MKNIVLFLLLFTFISHSQTKDEKQQIINQTNAKKLQELSLKYSALFKKNKFKADSLATIFGWEKIIKSNKSFSQLIGVNSLNLPIYYSTFNNGAGVTTRANKLYLGGGLGLNIQGEGMISAVWDAGSSMPNHELFTGRIQVMDGTTFDHYHSTHVAGTVMGSELFQSGNARGIAFKSNLHSYDWANDIAEVANAASNGLLLSNHSYGYSNSSISLFQWGKYDSDSQAFDEIMFNAPYYQFVCAAGNSRDDGLNTAKNGYDLLTGHAVSKNSIVVAAINEVQNYSNPSSVVMSSFSSWGPTDDGRIKPDISAKGVDTFSAMNDSPSSYDFLSGTSMASPSVSGTLLLFQQYYNQLNGSFMKAATLKGLMIHSADEAGVSPGPDYGYGWGLINAEKGANVITKENLQSLILENTLNNTASYTINVNSLGTEPLLATLCWTDPAGTIPSQTIDDSTPNLINDLDIRITQNTSTYFPWKLNVASLPAGAIKADNTVDNVEKVEINNPSGGYTITISHKGNLQNTLQNYSLIVSGIAVRDFWFSTQNNEVSICQGGTSATYNFNLQTKSNFSDTITFSTVNLPIGVNAQFSPTAMNSNGVFSLNLSNVNILTPGVYQFTVKGQSSSEIYELPVTLICLSPTFSPVILSLPTNASNSITIPATLEWVADINAQEYDIQVSTNTSFSTIVASETVSTTNFTVSSLQNGTTYYWRIKPKNNCGEGNYSNYYSFTTACAEPLIFNINTASSSSINIGWIELSGATSWEVEYVPVSTNPTGIGATINSNPLTIDGLLSNTCYNLYVRSICSTGTSAWSQPFQFCTQPNYCSGDHFYDTGGLSNNYQNSENYTKTIYPENANNRVRAIFNSFQLESCCDRLTVYNGPNTTSPILYQGGSTSPGILVSTHLTGALTFRFISDSSATYSGWDATIICEPIPVCAFSPTNLVLTGANDTSLTIGWNENGTSTSWEIEIVPQGSNPTGTGIITTNNPHTFSELSAQTTYKVFVRSICSGGFSEWTSSDWLTTSCAPINAPFTYTVENQNLWTIISDCWNGTPTAYANNSNYFWTTFQSYNSSTSTGPALAHSGNKFFATYPNNSTSSNSVTELFTPLVNISSLNQPILEFYSFRNGSGVGSLHIDIFNNGNLTTDALVLTGAYQNSAYDDWQKHIVDLSSYTGTIVVRFRALSGSLSNNNEIDLDDISIKEMPACPFTPSSIALTGANETSLTVGWTENGTSTSWEVEIVPQGSNFTGSGFIITSNPYTFTGLSTDVCYKINIRSICAGGNSDWVTQQNLCTVPDYCGGIHFYDTGGVSGNYQNNENWTETIYPENANNRVRAIFNLFQLESCCDRLTVYNGPNTTSPILYQGGSTSPGNLVSTHSTGALTFRFTSDSSSAYSGWDATIICEPIPACSFIPTNLALTGAAETSLTVSWTENGTSTNWEVEIVPQGSNFSGNGFIITSNPYTFTGLSTDVCYKINIRSICTGGTSDWVTQQNLCTVPDYCGGINFYDTGGVAGSYQNNENWTETIYPENANNRVRAIFNSFQLESCCDRLTVYNGPNTTSPILYQGGSTSPGNLVSTHSTGALTFSFTSDSSSTYSGWDATIFCEPIPACAFSPTNLVLTGANETSLTVSWTENGISNSWEVEIVPQGSNFTGNGFIITSNPYTFTGLSTDVCYKINIRSICAGGTSDWVTQQNICTVPDYCGGIHFYDTGGVSGSYQDNENWTETIYPENANSRVRAIFNSFQLESCCDRLTVYNGPNTSSPILYQGGSTSPGNLVSTDSTGALTFRFTSDYSITNSGWDATIICEQTLGIDNPIIDNFIYYPNPVEDVLTINSSITINSFIVYDLLGRNIMAESINKDKFDIDLSVLPTSNYIIKLITIDGLVKEIKIVKK